MTPTHANESPPPAGRGRLADVLAARGGKAAPERDAPLASAAICPNAALAQNPPALSEGETALMRELLARLSAS